MKKEIDHRIGYKVIATIELEDKGQDFIELDLLQNDVILGHSPIFSMGRLSLIGIGTLDGMTYFPVDGGFKRKDLVAENDLYVYFKNTGEKDPLPWKAQTLKYRVIGLKKAIKPNRFIKK